MSPLAREIFTTTGMDRGASERLGAALDGVPPFVIQCFWAMVKVGIYSEDEMIDRIAALRVTTAP